MSVTTSVATELTFNTSAGEWPIKEVTVYNTQAEVRRQLTFEPTNAGLTMLKLRGLPNTINSSSLRAVVASKNAKLVEVFYNVETDQGKADPEINEKIKKLNHEINKVDKKRTRANFKLQRIDAHQNTVLNALNGNKIEDSQTAISPDVHEKINEALKFYEEAREEIKEELKVIQEERNKLNIDKNALQREQNKLTRSTTYKVANILIDVPEQILKKGSPPIDMDLFYLVTNASWYARYDVRVTKDSKSAALTYYGEVTNGTQENWVEVEMSLSTANPSVGGSLPILPRKTVDFKGVVEIKRFEEKPMLQKSLFSASRDKSMMMQRKKKKRVKRREYEQEERRRLSITLAPQEMVNFNQFGSLSLLADEDDMLALDGLDLNANFAPEMPMPMPAIAPPPITAVASGESGSTLFKLQRLANINSDNKPHRQTISILSLKSLITHAASPRVAKDVYMKMSTTNESAFPLLSGQMSVFIDGSFLTNSTLKLVRPNEDFVIYLGIDDSVKLNYSPETTKTKTIAGGRLKRKKDVKKLLRTISRDITVINNNESDINCLIYEQFPFSNDAKLKVKLISPVIGKTDGGATHKLNSVKNLETTTVIKSGSRFKMKFEYSLEWPENEQIQIVEKAV